MRSREDDRLRGERSLHRCAVDNEASSSRMLWIAHRWCRTDRRRRRAGLVARPHAQRQRRARPRARRRARRGGGGRTAGAVAAVSAALSFNFFHTVPYLTLEIDSARRRRDDLAVAGCRAGRRAARVVSPPPVTRRRDRLGGDPPHPSRRHRRRTWPAHVGGHDHGRPSRADRVAAAPQLPVRSVPVHPPVAAAGTQRRGLRDGVPRPTVGSPSPRTEPNSRCSVAATCSADSFSSPGRTPPSPSSSGSSRWPSPTRLAPPSPTPTDITPPVKTRLRGLRGRGTQ